MAAPRATVDDPHAAAMASSDVHANGIRFHVVEVQPSAGPRLTPPMQLALARTSWSYCSMAGPSFWSAASGPGGRGGYGGATLVRRLTLAGDGRSKATHRDAGRPRRRLACWTTALLIRAGAPADQLTALLPRCGDHTGVISGITDIALPAADRRALAPATTRRAPRAPVAAPAVASEDFSQAIITFDTQIPALRAPGMAVLRSSGAITGR